LDRARLCLTLTASKRDMLEAATPLDGWTEILTNGIAEERDEVEKVRLAAGVGPDEDVQRLELHLHIPKAAEVLGTDCDQGPHRGEDYRALGQPDQLRARFDEPSSGFPARRQAPQRSEMASPRPAAAAEA